MRSLYVAEASLWLPTLKAGETILLSGRVYTARDAAHKRLDGLLDAGEALPFDLQGAFVYYAGPTPAPAGKVCGSFGPTTSCRMDGFASRLYRRGLAGTIGKGGRSPAVADAIKETGGTYLIAVGGAGAFCASKITSCREIAFHDLGCESIKELTFKDFPLTVAIDSKGNDLFAR
ncbi:MAG: TRZ/ATZ family protein [Ruminococcaceae bacterium]|nr:TRZ/ATZ family protein [Oscillospiraceae bacterium]